MFKITVLLLSYERMQICISEIERERERETFASCMYNNVELNSCGYLNILFLTFCFSTSHSKFKKQLTQLKLIFTFDNRTFSYIKMELPNNNVL